MRLLVVRHAIAESRRSFARSGRPDALRPLTPEGRRKMRRNARGLRAEVPAIDHLASSALARALDTARIVSREYGMDVIEELAALAPDADPADLLPWLRRHARRDVVAVVGHEPHLGKLVSWLVARGAPPFGELAKGGACLFDLGARPRPGGATLVWLLTPSQLCRLGR